MPPSQKYLLKVYIFASSSHFSLSGTVNEYSTGFCKCKPNFSAFFHYLYFTIVLFIKILTSDFKMGYCEENHIVRLFLFLLLLHIRIQLHRKWREIFFFTGSTENLDLYNLTHDSIQRMADITITDHRRYAQDRLMNTDICKCTKSKITLRLVPLPIKIHARFLISGSMTSISERRFGISSLGSLPRLLQSFRISVSVSNADAKFFRCLFYPLPDGRILPSPLAHILCLKPIDFSNASRCLVALRVYAGHVQDCCRSLTRRKPAHFVHMPSGPRLGTFLRLLRSVNTPFSSR